MMTGRKLDRGDRRGEKGGGKGGEKEEGRIMDEDGEKGKRGRAR